MQNHRSQGFVQDRGSGHSLFSGRWLNQHIPLNFDVECLQSENQVGRELLSVAHTAITWWEKHKHDMIIENGQEVPRYEFKPSFISHAQEILKKAMA